MNIRKFLDTIIVGLMIIFICITIIYEYTDLNNKNNNLHISITDIYNKLNTNKKQIYNLKRDNERNKILFNALEQELNRKCPEINYKKMLKGSVIVVGGIGFGSGTIIKKTKSAMYILTCYHVIADIIEYNEKNVNKQLGVSIGYTVFDEKNKVIANILYGAEIIKYNQENDLAIVKTNMTDITLEEIMIADKHPKKGDIVYTVGHPLGLFRTISKGILSNEIEFFYVTDGIITYGNSGGGLYNEKAELIGVPSRVPVYPTGMGYVPESSLGFSINLNTIQEFVKDII